MFQALTILLTSRLPGELRAKILKRLFGHDVHPTARIGISLISVGHLEMGERSSIGNLNRVAGLELVQLDDFAAIGNLNWITGIPVGGTGSFSHIPSRRSALIIEHDAVLTNRHYIDCTDTVHLEPFCGIGGVRTTVLTHSVNFGTGLQECSPVRISTNCLIATNCTVLHGSVAPPFSAIAAGSTLRGKPEESGLYTGVPAKKVGDIPREAKLFNRERGHGYVN